MLIYQELIQQRKAVEYLMQLTIARNAWTEDVSEFVDSLKKMGQLPERDYLESEMDKSGLEALKSRLIPRGHKKVE